MRRASSIIRKHRAADRVYIPSDARDNQYILAEVPLTDELIKLVVGEVDTNAAKPYQKFYQTLAKTAFDIVEKHGIAHANFVANNKLVRVRYSGEHQVLHTEQQSFFFYCPSHNATFKSYFDGAVRARKVKFLFLATGEELRLNSAKFHKSVHEAVVELSETIGLKPGDVKVRDHQHLTFELFSKEKGLKDTITHSFKEISARYHQQGYDVGPEHTSATYAVANVPVARRLLKNTPVDHLADEPYTEFYKKVESAFKQAAKDNQIDHAAMIANGLSSFVRYDKEERSDVQGELLLIGFDPKNQDGEIRSLWQGDQLVDTIKFVFFADEADEKNNNYGKFTNQVMQTMRNFADLVYWKKDHDDILVRIHQHINRKV